MMGKEDERVLTIKREEAFPEGSWHGINPDEPGRIVLLASTKGEFLRREEVEDDPTIKQIAPYIVFQHEDKILLMQRRGDHTDQRLANRYSLGIGGHLREEDLQEGEGIWEWARREFEEEVDYKDNLTPEIIGAINDDNDFVGKVHLGIVIIARGSSPQIRVRDEHKSGKLVTIYEASRHYNQMEGWSRLVLDYLKTLRP